MRRGYEIACGEPFPETTRCTGWSTGRALSIIGKCMQQPGLQLYINDMRSGQILRDVLFLLAKLELKHFRVDYKARLIKYDLFTSE
jgi:hypothetical protein